MKTAICLYGQARTWKYAGPWIKSQYNGDYFCATKDFNNQYAGKEEQVIEESELIDLFDFFNAKSVFVEHKGDFNGYGPAHYLFSSMIRAWKLLEDYQTLHNCFYDTVFMQRYDTVCFNWNWPDSFPHNTVVFGNPNRYHPHEGASMGLQDWILAGSNAAIGALMASLLQDVYARESAHHNNLFSAHVILQKAIERSNIRVQTNDSCEAVLLRPDIADHIDEFPSPDHIKENWLILTK